MRETDKFVEKSKSWVAKWSSLQEFYDKPRGGRPTILHRTANKVIEKTKHNGGNFSSKNKQTIKEQGFAWICNNSLKIYVKKIMETFERKKAPTLRNNQRKGRLVFVRKYRKFTANEWENVLFSDKCPKYLFHLPNLKNDIVWRSQESQVPSSYQVKGSAKWMGWGGMTAALLRSILSRKDKL